MKARNASAIFSILENILLVVSSFMYIYKAVFCDIILMIAISN